MPDLPPIRVCPRCGRVLPATTTRDFCAKCLLREALREGPLADVLAVTAGGGSLPRSFGSYELLAEVARGGMGIVYRARQLPVNRIVAVKVLAAGWFAAPDFVQRFRTEAEVVASLDHPNIVPIHEVGDCDGQPFFSMKFVEGGSLAHRISDFKSQISEREAAGLLTKLAHAVHYAHQRGVLHRDIKPGNVLLDPQGEPQLTDFGLARLVANDSTLTHTLAMLGTPSYMSPEQARGEAKQLTTAVDVYSLGAVFYELLTGQPPFAGGTTMETVRQVLDCEPRRPSTIRPGLDRDLETICLKCLEKDPGRRYGSAEALAADLARWRRHEPILAHPPAVTYRLWKSWQRNRVVWLAGTAVLLALVVGLGLAATAWRQAAHAESRAAGQRDLAQERLYESLTREAHSLRTIRAVGYRRELMECIRQALAIPSRHRNVDALRSELAQCLGDAIGLDPVRLDGIPQNFSDITLDTTGALAAVGTPDGRLVFYPTQPGKTGISLEQQGPISSLAFSPDSRSLFGCIDHSGAKLAGTNRLIEWRVAADGSWHRSSDRPQPGLRELVATTSGVIAVCDDAAHREVRLLEAATGELKGSVSFSAGQNFPAIFEPSDDGHLVAFSGGGGQDQSATVVELWDVANRRRRVRLDPGMGPVRHLAFSRDGRYLACSMDVGMTAYDTTRFQVVAVCREFGTPRTAWGGDGSSLAVPLPQEAGLLLFRVNRSSDAIRVPLAHEVKALRSSLNGSALMVVEHRDHATMIRLADDSERLRLTGHDGGVPAVEFSPDGARVASTGKDGTVRLWDVASGKQLQSWEGTHGEGQSVAFSPDGRWVASGYYQNNWVKIWSVDGGQPVLTLGDPGSELGQTWSCNFSPDGRILVAAGAGLRAWELTTSAADGGRPALQARLLFSEEGHLRNTQFHPSGRWLAVQGTIPRATGNSGGVIVRGLEPDSRPEVILREAFAVQTLALLARTDELMYWTMDDHLHVVSRPSRQVVRKLSKLAPGEVSSSHVGNLRVSPDGTQVAVASPSGRGVNLHDVATGRRLLSLPDDPGSVWWLAWHPSGRQLAVSRSDGDISVWNLDAVRAELGRVGLAP